MVIPVRSARVRILCSSLLLFVSQGKPLLAQDNKIGLYVSPVISWFKTDVKAVKNQGARAGFIFSIFSEKSITDNWYFIKGLSFISSSGRLISSKSYKFRFPEYTCVVEENKPIIYRIQYISTPVGIIIKTSEKGNFTYFAEFGLDPKIVISGKVDIPSLRITNESSMTEIRRLNLSYHLNGGINYLIGSRTSVTMGLGYESNIFDITKDVENQDADKTTQKLLKFIFGFNF